MLVLDELQFHPVVELLQLATAQLFLDLRQRAGSELEDEDALFLLAGRELEAVALLAVPYQWGGLPSLDEGLSHAFEHLDLDELALAGEAGPQFVDVLVAVLEGTLHLALSLVVETDDLEQVPLSGGRGTLSLRFWLRLFTASSRYCFSYRFIPALPVYF
jgi:hypothetical protein